MLCIKLVNYWYKYTEMHGQQNVKICYMFAALRASNKKKAKDFYNEIYGHSPVKLVEFVDNITRWK